MTPMEKYAPNILQIQKNIQHFDVKQCKQLASWLAEHIRELEIDKKLYKTTIKQLHLSVRAYNVLRSSGIFTIGQLLTLSMNWDNIKVLKGAGEKVVQEIQQKVAAIRSGMIK
jgi:DNA-directed RNA polymerase alpha subunit